MYHKRLIDKNFKKMLNISPVVLLEGAKAVGKTMTSLQISKQTFNLDNELERNIVISNFDSFLNSDKKPILFDEWQYAPALWQMVRRKVDDGLENGSIIFTGSSPKVNSNVHSGAGRFLRLNMYPYTIEEREMSSKLIRISDLINKDVKLDVVECNLTIEDYLKEIAQSGFPGIRGKNNDSIHYFIKDYIKNLIEHEFEENGYIIKKPLSLYAWLVAYAACSGTNATYQTILNIAMANNSESPSRITANTYRDALNTLKIISEVSSTAKLGKLTSNLSKSSKHFLMDPALMISLLNIDIKKLSNYDFPAELTKFETNILGQLIESLVAQSLIVYADYNDALLTYYRNNKDGREIDFIIEKGNTVLLFEVKASSEYKKDYVKHLNWMEEKIKGKYQVKKILLYCGKYAYLNDENIYLVPIGMLGC